MRPPVVFLKKKLRCTGPLAVNPLPSTVNPVRTPAAFRASRTTFKVGFAEGLHVGATNRKASRDSPTTLPMTFIDPQKTENCFRLQAHALHMARRSSCLHIVMATASRQR